MTYLEGLVLGKLRAEGTHPQDHPYRIRSALYGCAGERQCIQAAFDMRSRRQGFDYPEKRNQGGTTTSAEAAEQRAFGFYRV
jgi:hypothetical protein